MSYQWKSRMTHLYEVPVAGRLHDLVRHRPAGRPEQDNLHKPVTIQVVCLKRQPAATPRLLAISIWCNFWRGGWWWWQAQAWVWWAVSCIVRPPCAITGKKRAQVWKKLKKIVKAVELGNFGTGTLELVEFWNLITSWNSGY